MLQQIRKSQFLNIIICFSSEPLSPSLSPLPHQEKDVLEATQPEI